MLTHRVFRTVAFGLSLVGIASFAQGPASADDPAADSPAAEATDAAEDNATNQSSNFTETPGKIVVIDPQGHRHEYDFGRSFVGPEYVARFPHGRLFRISPDGPLKEEEPPLWVDRPVHPVERFFIGLHCTPADETLQQQLGLDGHGLVVRHIVPDMPAAEAGLREHDILLSVGGDPLDAVEELMNAVEVAGESPIELTYLRAGEQQTVEVTPVKRDSLFAFDGPRNPDEARYWVRSQLLGDDVTIPSAPYRLEAFGPGILLRDLPAADAINDRLEMLEQRLDELTQTVDELRQSLDEQE